MPVPIITWSKTQAGFNASEDLHITSMVEYNGKLYAATHPVAPAYGKVYESTDGITWTLSHTFNDATWSPGNPPEGEPVISLAVHGSDLYALWSSFAVIYKFDGATWTRPSTNTHLSTGGPVYPSCSSVFNRSQLISYGGELYVSCATGSPRKPIWKSTDGGVTWAADLTLALPADGWYGTCVAEFGGDLFLGVRAGTGNVGKVYKKSSGVWGTGMSLTPSSGFTIWPVEFCIYNSTLFIVGTHSYGVVNEPNDHLDVYEYDGISTWTFNGSFSVTTLYQTVTSLTWDGVKATAVVPTHGYVNGQEVVIEGAVDAAYDGFYTITYVDPNTFTYIPSSTPSGPGHPATAALSNIDSREFGTLWASPLDSQIRVGTVHGGTGFWQHLVSNDGSTFTTSEDYQSTTTFPTNNEIVHPGTSVYFGGRQFFGGGGDLYNWNIARGSASVWYAPPLATVPGEPALSSPFALQAPQGEPGMSEGFLLGQGAGGGENASEIFEIGTGSGEAGVEAPIIIIGSDFSGAPTIGGVPLLVNFTTINNGSPITTYLWDFGDLGTSTAPNPSHTYLSGGVFTVTLILDQGLPTEQTIVKPNYIFAIDPTTDFSAVPLSGLPPLTVLFTDLSNFGPTSWLWDFGDPASGVDNISTIQNPIHAYNQPGVYTVSLTSIRDIISDTETKISYITVDYPPPVASFVASPVTGFVPLIVNFTNSSSGFPTAYLWDFGDGFTSTEESPEHIYTIPDTYTVTLTVTNPVGSDTTSGTITAMPIIEVVADFYAESMMPGVGDQIIVQFRDASLNAISWEWEFGDPDSGIFNTSTDQNPIHTYPRAGVYEVHLIARNGPFSDATCRNILVTLDVLRYQEIWGSARFADGTPMATNRVVAHQRIFTTEYDCPSDATDPFHAYKTVDDAGTTRFLVRCRGHVIGIPNSGFEDGDLVYLSIGGRVATDEGGTPVSVPFYMTLPSNPMSHVELNLVFPLASSYAMPAGGTFEDFIEVTLHTNVFPAIIWYTVDGSDPRTSLTRQLFSGPILMEQGTTVLKFYTEDPLGPDESVKQEVYIVNGPLVYPNIPAGEYSSPKQIELRGNRAGTIYYQLNNAGAYIKYLTPITVDGGTDGIQVTTIKAYLIDYHGHVGITSTFEYRIDLINPTIQVFTINNGDPVTTNQLVTVQVQASSYTNTVTGLLLSTYPDFHDARVQLYVPEVTFELPAPDGVKNLYAQVFDQFDPPHASTVKHTSIVLNTMVPIITVSSSPTEPIGATSYLFTGTKSANSGILVTVNGGTEILVVAIDEATTWGYAVPLTEGTNTIVFQGITSVGNRSVQVTRTVTVYVIPAGVTEATTLTGPSGTWRIPYVFIDERTGEEGTEGIAPPAKQHENLKMRQHDFRIVIESDSATPPVITFPQAGTVLTENVITVTGTADPGSIIRLRVEPKDKVPA